MMPFLSDDGMCMELSIFLSMFSVDIHVSVRHSISALVNRSSFFRQ